MEDFILPSPRNLAKKEETRTVSLRVKEKTMTAFEKYAKQNNTTASALINGVLDSYIFYWQQKDINQNPQEYYKRDIESTRKVMAQYLEKLASRMNKFTDKELCYAIFENNDLFGFDNFYNDEVGKYGIIKYEDFINEVINGRDFGGEFYVATHDSEDHEFTCVHWDEKHKSKMNIYDDEDGAAQGCGVRIYVPAEKFPILGYIIQQYKKKSDILYGKNRKQLFSKDTDRQIVDVINECKVDSPMSRIKFAKRIAKILSDFEGVQDE